MFTFFMISWTKSCDIINFHSLSLPIEFSVDYFVILVSLIFWIILHSLHNTLQFSVIPLIFSYILESFLTFLTRFSFDYIHLINIQLCCILDTLHIFGIPAQSVCNKYSPCCYSVLCLLYSCIHSIQRVMHELFRWHLLKKKLRLYCW